jgi:hypothetical protein
MARKSPKRNERRENRIAMEIECDAYDAYERRIGWYCYLESKLQFPFRATCILKRAISPLHVGERVEVIGMPGEDECLGEMFITIRRQDEELAVPLSQLKPMRSASARTRQAIEDWQYWVEMGREF